MITVSDEVQSGYEAPHENLLGPLIYILHVNDITYMSKSCHCVIYVDDTCLFF